MSDGDSLVQIGLESLSNDNICTEHEKPKETSPGYYFSTAGRTRWRRDAPESALVTMYLPAGASKDLSVVKHQGPEEELREQKDRVTWTNFPKAPLPKLAIPYP